METFTSYQLPSAQLKVNRVELKKKKKKKKKSCCEKFKKKGKNCCKSCPMNWA